VNEGTNEVIHAGDIGPKQARQVKTGNAKACFFNYSNITYGFECDKDPAGHPNIINGWKFDSLHWKQG
jgi:hypothetical protein